MGAILSLQSDDCLAALNVDMAAIKERCTEDAILHARVGVRDFDHDDQAAMLPEVVRVLAALAGTGRRLYVHCTAGINRAPLAVAAYLAFAKGWQVNDAVAAIKKSRAIANPYLDSLYAAKARMLHGRNDELTHLSRKLYEERQAKGQGNNGRNDWYDAEDLLISRMFARRAAADADFVASLEAVMTKHGNIARGPSEEEIRLSNLLAATRKKAAEADELAAAEFARAQLEATAALAAAQKAGADALAAAQAKAASDLAKAQKDASDAALAAAAALDEANAAAATALSTAAEQAAAELDAAAAEAQAAQEVAARQIRAALDAADVQAKASAARQAVLENEVRRLADAAAAAVRFDAESHKTKSDLEMAAMEMVKQSSTEVQRMRELCEELKREIADLKIQLAEARTEVVLLQGVAPQAAAAEALAAVAATPLPAIGAAASAAQEEPAAAVSNGNGNGAAKKAVKA